MRITATFDDPGSAAASGKLADVTLSFDGGLLDGLKLTGFGLWRSKYAGRPRNMTVPARSYHVNGERRSYALLRPADGSSAAALDDLRDALMNAYDSGENPAILQDFETRREYVARTAAPVPAPEDDAPRVAPVSTAPAPASTTEPRHYDTPDAAAAAAKRGELINLSDLIPQRRQPATPPRPTPGASIRF